MHPNESKVRAAADAFLGAKQEAEAAGFRVFWQTSLDGKSLVVDGGPSAVAAPAPSPAPLQAAEDDHEA